MFAAHRWDSAAQTWVYIGKRKTEAGATTLVETAIGRVYGCKAGKDTDGVEVRFYETQNEFCRIRRGYWTGLPMTAKRTAA